MARTHDALDDDLRAFLAAQHLFFVATAPLAPDGHVNLSPKGYDTFRVLGPTEVAYLDLTGSGVETIAHLRENGRITIMFCALQGPPRIVRLHGRGEAVTAGDDRFEELAAEFPDQLGVRAVVRVDVERISSSCGFSIPLYDFAGERETLTEWAARKGDGGVREYQRTKNVRSLDGLPALAARP